MKSSPTYTIAHGCPCEPNINQGRDYYSPIEFTWYLLKFSEPQHCDWPFHRFHPAFTQIWQGVPRVTAKCKGLSLSKYSRERKNTQISEFFPSSDFIA